MNSIGHLVVSIVKSVLRISACVWCVLTSDPVSLAVGFFLAELLGIAEELVDKRK